MSTKGRTTSQMSVSQLHHAAREAFDKALASENAGAKSKAETLFRSALSKESAAAARPGVESRTRADPIHNPWERCGHRFTVPGVRTG
jgi:hypothetical protein